MSRPHTDTHHNQSHTGAYVGRPRYLFIKRRSFLQRSLKLWIRPHELTAKRVERVSNYAAKKAETDPAPRTRHTARQTATTTTNSRMCTNQSPHQQQRRSAAPPRIKCRRTAVTPRVRKLLPHSLNLTRPNTRFAVRLAKEGPPTWTRLRRRPRIRVSWAPCSPT